MSRLPAAPGLARSSEPVRTKSASRSASLDALRGLVMIIMALDHVRDFFHVGAISFQPTDLTRTTAVLFFTRWITHFCLPVFMLTAGMGAYLWMQQKQRSRRQLSRFLWTRGIWFIVLELSVMRFAYNFSFSGRFPVLLLILWIFGVCMLVLAALVYLPAGVLAALSAVVILLHNCLDPINAARFGSAAWVWNLLHQPGVFPVAGHMVLVTYTLIPWAAVMALGFCFGRIYTLEPFVRRTILLRAGWLLTALFVLLRLVNIYGDPLAWLHQKTTLFTLLSFLNCTKYPASLSFLLMTLGPALLVLAYLDKHPPGATNPLIVFGRVPLFYFVLHFYAIHAATVLMAFLRYGRQAASFALNPPPSMGAPPGLFPANFGYSLPVVYTVWIALVLALYPLCRWFGNIKATRNRWWLSYL
jgi:uncharacterized membrane protein